METYQIFKLNNDTEYETVVEYDKNGHLQIKGLTFGYQGNAVLIQDGQHYIIETIENVLDEPTIEINPEVESDGSHAIVYDVQDDIQQELIERDEGDVMLDHGGCEMTEIIIQDIDQMSEPPPLHYPNFKISAPSNYGESSQSSNLEMNIVCKFCKLSFAGVNVYNKHLKTHDKLPKELKHVIENAIPNGATKIEMVELSEQNTDQKLVYPCALCDKKYIWHKFLVTHSKSHKVPASFVCTICGGSYEGLYHDHMKTHVSGTTSRECAKCKLSFTTLKSYKLHINSIHMENSDDIVRKHKCDLCDKHYKSLTYLREHKRIMHTREKLHFLCELCGKSFGKYGCFAEHKKTHLVQKALKCPICSKIFTKRRYLKAHIMRHPKTVDLDKIFVEDYDGAVSARKFLFGPNRPKTTPKIVQKLECAICFKEFKKLRYLKSHISRHPDEFIRRRLKIDTSVPIPALISNGSFNANNLIQNSKNSLINFQSSLDNLNKSQNIQSDDDSSSSSEYQSDSYDDMNGESWQNESKIDENNQFIGVELSSDPSFALIKSEKISRQDSSNLTIKCLKCEKCFKNSNDLNDHELIHAGDNPLYCVYCNIYFAVEARFLNHLKDIHHQRKPRDFDYESNYELNIFNRANQTDNNSSMYSCQVCGHLFLNETILEEHESLHLMEDPLTCLDCNIKFVKESSYIAHLETHKTVVDEIQEKTTSESTPDIEVRVLRNRKMNRNAVAHKPTRKSRKKAPTTTVDEHVPIKTEIHPTKIYLKSKTKVLNSIPPPNEQPLTIIKNPDPPKKPKLPARSKSEKKQHKCHICHKSYTTPFYLREHLQIHSGIRPYKCKTCGKTFSTTSSYREHLEVHVTEKKFKCTICNVSFAASRYLRAHIQRHAMKKLPDGGKKYECDQCTKKYQSKSSLKEHKVGLLVYIR